MPSTASGQPLFEKEPVLLPDEVAFDIPPAFKEMTDYNFSQWVNEPVLDFTTSNATSPPVTPRLVPSFPPLSPPPTLERCFSEASTTSIDNLETPKDSLLALPPELAAMFPTSSLFPPLVGAATASPDHFQMTTKKRANERLPPRPTAVKRSRGGSTAPSSPQVYNGSGFAPNRRQTSTPRTPTLDSTGKDGLPIDPTARKREVNRLAQVKTRQRKKERVMELEEMVESLREQVRSLGAEPVV